MCLPLWNLIYRVCYSIFISSLLIVPLLEMVKQHSILWKQGGHPVEGKETLKNGKLLKVFQIFPSLHPQGLVTIFFLSLDYSKKPQGRNLKCQIFIQQFFKIVLYWCLDLIRHNISTHLKHNKYIFDISIPFCHPSCLHVSTRPNCYVRFDWSVIFRVLIANQHSLQSWC